MDIHGSMHMHSIIHSTATKKQTDQVNAAKYAARLVSTGPAQKKNLRMHTHTGMYQNK